MNISESNDFVKNLQFGSQKGQYIKVENGIYSVITDKANKNLKTQDIARLAKEAFECYNNEDNLSVEKRAVLMGDLKVGIKAYTTRVHKSKNLFNRIAAFFGCKSKHEKALEGIFRQISLNEFQFNRKLRAFNSIEGEGARATDLELEKPLNVMKQVNRKVLEGTKFKDKSIEQGTTQGMGLRSYLNDLIDFRQLNLTDADLNNKLNPTIEALEFAFFVTTLKGCLSYKNPMGNINFSKKDIEKELNLRILERIQDLKENGVIGQQVILPGGFTQGKDIGHGVIYQMIKTDADTCSFTIVNTGIGADISFSLANLGKILFTDRVLVEDISYTQVNFGQLNLDFIEKLIKDEADVSDKNPMNSIIKDLDQRLGIAHKGSGRRHVAQTKGSCAYKSVSSWIKDSLGEEDYNRFKLFVTKSEIAKLNELKDKPLVYNPNKATIDTMLEQSNQVLEKRADKVAN